MIGCMSFKPAPVISTPKVELDTLITMTQLTYSVTAMQIILYENLDTNKTPTKEIELVAQKERLKILGVYLKDLYEIRSKQGPQKYMTNPITKKDL